MKKKRVFVIALLLVIVVVLLAYFLLYHRHGTIADVYADFFERYEVESVFAVYFDAVEFYELVPDDLLPQALEVITSQEITSTNTLGRPSDDSWTLYIDGTTKTGTPILCFWTSMAMTHPSSGSIRFGRPYPF